MLSDFADKICPRTPSSDLFPDVTVGGLGFSVKDFINREAITDSLKDTKRIKKIGLPTGIGSQEQVQASQL